MRSKALYVLCLTACLPIPGQITCTMKQVKTFTASNRDCTLVVVVNLTCTGGTSTAPGQNVPGVTFQFNADVPFVEDPGVSGVVGSMTIDQAPGGGTLTHVTPSGGMSYSGPPINGVGGSGLDYSSGSVPNFFEGSLDDSSSIIFRNIPFDPSSNGRNLTVWFWIRACDANGSSSVTYELNLEGSMVATGTLLVKKPQARDPAAAPADSGSGPPTYTLTPSSLDLGADIDCFLNRFTSGSAPGNSALNASLLGSNPVVPSATSAMLSYYTLFPDCLQTRATGYQDDFSQTYPNDLGFTFPGFPSPFANFGTELEAVFNNIPAGVSVFVQSSVSSVLGSILLTSPGTAVGTTGLTEIPVSNGSATAIWETQSASATATGSFDIPVYFAYQSGVAAPSNISVVESLASPPGGVQMAQPPASLIQPVLFSINTGAATTPKLTATVDARPCIVGVTFWTNNACTPEGSLLITTVSDSASVEVSATITSSGGLTYYAPTLSASTPTLTEITPNASNATPGTYQETLTITGIGAESSVSVSAPFTVTVLPANNPVFELNAVFDAFSYQSETIAPGQIYTIFGSNFGPAALVTGTVDSSGKLGTTVSNTQVMFDGIASPLLYVVNGQLSGVAPFELAGKSSTNVQIVYSGLTSPTVAVPVAASSISIASADSSGGNGAVVINQDGTLNTVSNPASVGDTVVIYASYAGPFANGVTGTDGRSTTGPPYPAPAGTPAVSIGGVQATSIPYFGNAPGFLESVMQINVVIPAGVQPSPYNPLVISAGGATSAGWTSIAVQ
jgi:uncharacterized protein (TIGR03437 family)